MFKNIDYIQAQVPNEREMMLCLHHILVDFPTVQTKISYGVPFYYQKKAFCYLSIKKKQLEIAFIQGHLLSNEQGLLQARGRKQIHGILFSSVSEVDEQVVREIIQEALVLDDFLGAKR